MLSCFFTDLLSTLIYPTIPMNTDIPDNFEEFPEEEIEQELSYAEILANAVLNGEIVITIPIEDEERVKQGLKNYKSKQTTRSKDDGLLADNSVLSFMSELSMGFRGCVDLHIISKNRGVVKIKQMRVPDNIIPD